jgi:hypothetical protein
VTCYYNLNYIVDLLNDHSQCQYQKIDKPLSDHYSSLILGDGGDLSFEEWALEDADED